MALEGSLKDFSVLDILQLVATQKKTGALTIASKKGKIVVDFKEGMVTSAFHVKKGEQLPLDDYLLTSGRVSEEVLAKVRKSHAETGLALDEILIRDGYLTEDEFRQIVTFKIQEIIDELFMWNEGTYRFELEKELYAYSRVQVRLQTEALILEGARRTDELPRILSVLPDENLVIVKTDKVVSGLPPAEKKLLSLVSRPQTVAELVTKAAMGKFRAYEGIFNLIQAGVAETAGVREPEAVEEQKLPRWKLTRLWEILLVSSVAVVAVIVLWMNLGEKRRIGPISFERYTEWTTENRLKSLEASLDVYFIAQGRYPGSLGELQEAGLATFRDVLRFTYYPSRDLQSYRLAPVPGS
jgi:hypothetical protein